MEWASALPSDGLGERLPAVRKWALITGAAFTIGVIAGLALSARLNAPRASVRA